MTESADTRKGSDGDFPQNQQGPTPAESTVLKTQDEHKRHGTEVLEKKYNVDVKYLLMPEELKDKFIPLDFIQSCTREKTGDECIIITPEMLEAAKTDHEMDIDTAYERMNQLQAYNEINILEAQKTRCNLLETLFVDSQWSPALAEALEARDNTVVPDTLSRSVSVMRKKQDTKAK